MLLPSRDFLICSPSARLLRRDAADYSVPNLRAYRPVRCSCPVVTVSAVCSAAPLRFQWGHETDTALPTMLCAALSQWSQLTSYWRARMIPTAAQVSPSKRLVRVYGESKFRSAGDSRQGLLSRSESITAIDDVPHATVLISLAWRSPTRSSRPRAKDVLARRINVRTVLFGSELFLLTHENVSISRETPLLQKETSRNGTSPQRSDSLTAQSAPTTPVTSRRHTGLRPRQATKAGRALYPR
jgi:hypothetical protein